MHMRNRALVRNGDPKLRHDRRQIQGVGAYWLQNSHEHRSKPGVRGIHLQRQGPDRQQVSSPEQEDCVATTASDDTGSCAQQPALSKSPLKLCCPFPGHARTRAGQGLQGGV